MNEDHQLEVGGITAGSSRRLPPTCMADQTESTTPPDDPEPSEPDQAELAHSIIESLLDHTRVISDLIALMAQALDEDTTKALTQTVPWQAFLESRRRMERTQKDVEKFAETMKQR